MTSDQLYGLELIAALQALDPDAAPLAAALVRGGCLQLPQPTVAPMLTLLDAIGTSGTVASTDVAQAAMVRAWRVAQDRAGMNVTEPTAWVEVAALGVLREAYGATIFALSVTSAAMRAVAADDVAPLLH